MRLASRRFERHARRILFAAGALALALAPAVAGEARLRIAEAAAVQLTTPDRIASGVRLEAHGDVTRLVFDLTEKVEASAFALANPDRIIVDLPEINFQIDPAAGQPSKTATPRHSGRHHGGRHRPEGLAGIIGSFRFGLFAPGKSRIVIDLVEPARILKVAVEGEGRASHLVIELQRSDRASFASAARKAIQAQVAAAPADAGTAPAADPDEKRPLIVVDAGHGGVDAGAHSPDGTLEKDIVFEFAQTLAADLERTGRYRVLQTRTSDVFVPLGERVRIARTSGAALFVSIHADTLAGEPAVSGATVYTVSDKASDAEAERVAESENQADLVAGLDTSEEQTEVSDILFDLTRRETRAFSHVFARTLVGYWKEIGRLNKNPQRSAGFRVLKAPDVPSVLLELGYLSSTRDLASLVAPTWRQKAASTVARAIDQFFRSRGGKGQAEDAKTGTSLGLRPGSYGTTGENVAATIR